MITPCFWVKSLYSETLAHRKQKPSFSYTKEKMKGVNLGTNKFLFLLVLLLFGTIRISAQRIKNTKNRVNKTVRHAVDSVKSRINVFTKSGHSFATKDDDEVLVRRDTIYLPSPLVLVTKKEPIWRKVKKDTPLDLVKLTTKGIFIYFFKSIWKHLKFYFQLWRRWRRRKKYKNTYC